MRYQDSRRSDVRVSFSFEKGMINILQLGQYKEN